MENKAQLTVRHLGSVDYLKALRAMRSYTDRRSGMDADEVWLLEHPPVFTQGQAGKAEHVLAVGNIPVVQADRGGQVTYHGPGQLVAYLLIDLPRSGFGVRQLVDIIEDSIIATLAAVGVGARARDDAPGVYLADGAKIAALGLRVRKGCSFHGLALNLDLDLEPFSRINPCGYAGQRVARLKDLVPNWAAQDRRLLEDTLVGELAQRLGYTSWRQMSGLSEHDASESEIDD